MSAVCLPLSFRQGLLLNRELTFQLAWLAFKICLHLTAPGLQIQASAPRFTLVLDMQTQIVFTH